MLYVVKKIYYVSYDSNDCNNGKIVIIVIMVCLNNEILSLKGLEYKGVKLDVWFIMLLFCFN